MDMAKAYDDYWQSRRSGWTHLQALEHACYCCDVTKDELLYYLLQFD